jgi:signal transduction histidine kinase
MESNYFIFHDMLKGVQVIDFEFRYVYVNNTVADHGRVKRKELLGKTMMEKYPGIEKTEMFQFLSKCLKEKQSQRLLNKFEFPDGQFGYFELRMQPVPEGVLILSMDVSKEKKLETELRMLNDRLEELVEERTKELAGSLERERKLYEIKSRFVSFASHEFKTPLGAIEVCVNVLDDFNSPPNHEERNKFHGYIRTSVHDLFRILNDFLSLERLEQGNLSHDLEAIDVKEMVKLEISKIAFTCKEEQRIRHDHQGLKRAIVDVQILRSILTNLLSNAIKYSEKDIVIRTRLESHKLHIEVEDKGIGIPKTEKNRLFRKFFRASNTKNISGTGLGLNIVNRYVEILGGEIDFETREGHGATFRLEIPVSPAKQKGRPRLSTLEKER